MYSSSEAECGRKSDRLIVGLFDTLRKLGKITTSTGQVQQTVGDWLVSAGVRDGNVTLVPWIGTSAFAPQYVGNDGAYPIVVVQLDLPDDCPTSSAPTCTLPTCRR